MWFKANRASKIPKSTVLSRRRMKSIKSDGSLEWDAQQIAGGDLRADCIYFALHLQLAVCQKPDLCREGKSLPSLKQRSLILDRGFLLRAKLIFDKWPSHYPYISMGYVNVGGKCRMIFPHNFVSESIHFLLNFEPKLCKQKWKPGEEKTFGFFPSILDEV